MCGLILAMVCVGGITRLTGSGLSMTDWKPILGTMPPMSQADWEERFAQYQATPQYQAINREMDLAGFKAIFLWEYLHRLLGRFIGIAFAVPYIVFLWQKRIGGRLAGWLAVGFLLGGAQGLLGWYMVKSGLVNRPYVSHFRLAAHLSLAFFLFAYLWWIRLGLRPAAHHRDPGSARGVPGWLAGAVCAVVVLQVVYGAFMAGLKAGYAYSTFPTMAGYWVPPGLMALDGGLVANLLNNVIMVNFVHRGLGWILAGLAVVLAVMALKPSCPQGQRDWMLAIAFLTGIQFLLGALTVVFRVPVVLATLHQVTACLLVAAVTGWVHALTRAGHDRQVLEPVTQSPHPEDLHHGTMGTGRPAEGAV